MPRCWRLLTLAVRQVLQFAISISVGAHAPSCFLKTGEFVDTCQETQQEIIGLKLNPPNQPYNWCGGNRYEELSLLWA